MKKEKGKKVIKERNERKERKIEREMKGKE